MIELYLGGSPNVQKVMIALEEMDLDYRGLQIDLGMGEQFHPDFLALAPNAKIPVIIDHEPTDGGPPLTVFESGAILLYLAEKTGRFIPAELRGREEVVQWLFWQMAGLGPMSGQVAHFKGYAPESEQESYAAIRYRNEINRLYGVLNHRLADREYVAGDYSVADMACYPWIRYANVMDQNLEDFPNLARWYPSVRNRPAVQQAMKRNKSDVASSKASPEENKRNMIDQTAKTLYPDAH